MYKLILSFNSFLGVIKSKKPCSRTNSVVRDTTGKDLPEGFQTAEFVLEHGFLDFITPRKELKDKINLYIDLIQNNNIR